MSESNELEKRGTGVNILEPGQLLQLAKDTTEVGRYRLTNAVSQFFEDQELNEVEQRLASQIMLDLIRQAEVDLRETLAERLSVVKSVPAEVIVFLANDTISVAKPVLLNSPVLNDVDLIYIIASKGPEHWQSIASRQKLSPIVADRLADTEDPGTVKNLLGNTHVTLQKGCMKKMIKVALKNSELHESLLQRPEIDSALVADLYVCVTHALRTEIMQRFNLRAEAIDTAMDNLVEELTQEAKGIRQVTPEMISLAKNYAERSDIAPSIMVKTLRRGQVSFFVALFAEKLGLPADAVMKLIQKDNGKPFAVACRSINMMKSEFASIFLLSRGIRGGDKIVDQRELAMALKYYDAIKEYDANRVIQSWIKNPDTV